MKEKEKEEKTHITAEPKMENRFRFIFPEELGIEAWMIQKSNLPVYRFGKKKWDDIKIEFIDTIGPSVGLKLEALRKSKKKRIELSIELLDPTGVVFEIWHLKKCKLLSLDFGTLNYDGELLKPVLEIKPKDCVLDRKI